MRDGVIRQGVLGQFPIWPFDKVLNSIYFAYNWWCGLVNVVIIEYIGGYIQKGVK